MQSAENMKVDAMKATAVNRVNGVIGPSGLASMPWFNYVDAMIPDYMHGCLLDAMKTLMYLWSSTSSAEKSSGIATGWTGVDVSTPVFQEFDCLIS